MLFGFLAILSLQKYSKDALWLSSSTQKNLKLRIIASLSLYSATALAVWQGNDGQEFIAGYCSAESGPFLLFQVQDGTFSIPS